MLTPLDKLAYAARQGARVAWFMGHNFAARRYRQAKPDETPRPKPRKGRAGPGSERMFADMVRLFQRDLANAEAGHYPLPVDHDGSALELLARSRKFLADLPATVERGQAGRGDEVYSPELARRLPRYFLQNFHYQTGGYLTEDSAALYDLQVEVLFTGTANAMRRQCLVPLAEFMRGRDQRKVALADVACGTGRFLRFVKRAYPRISASGVDLSEAYLAEARAHLRPYTDVDLRAGNAEALPFEDRSLDVATSIFLFHELPPKVRRTVAAEFARVLKPGGRLIFMDSLQLGDVPLYDRLLEGFPGSFHEPYYASFIREDLKALFAAAGLAFVRAEPAFLSKLVVCEKPA